MKTICLHGVEVTNSKSNISYWLLWILQFTLLLNRIHKGIILLLWTNDIQCIYCTIQPRLINSVQLIGLLNSSFTNTSKTINMINHILTIFKQTKHSLILTYLLLFSEFKLMHANRHMNVVLSWKSNDFSPFYSSLCVFLNACHKGHAQGSFSI